MSTNVPKIKLPLDIDSGISAGNWQITYRHQLHKKEMIVSHEVKQSCELRKFDRLGYDMIRAVKTV